MEAPRDWEDLLRRSSVGEAAITISNTVTSNMDLLEDLVRSLASSLVEAATTTSNTPATIITDRQEALVDLQAWPARSWEAAAHLAVTSLAELSMDRTRITAMVAAISNMAVAASNIMDLIRATTAAAAVASLVA